MNRVVRGAILGACFAAMCVVTPAIGVSATLIGGTIAVAVAARRAEKAPELPIRLWFACTLGFLVGAVLFAPFAELPAVWIALCILSPLFGTMVCAIAGAMETVA